VLIRIITALVLAPLALAGIYFLDLTAFAFVVAAIIALASYEWAGLVFVPAKSKGGGQLIAATAFVGTTLAICGALWVRPDLQAKWLVVSSVCWVWRRGNLRWILFGLVVLPGAWTAMIMLKGRDPNLMVLVCFLVWGADAGAYFVGKAFGKRKLAPKVSPGKTWEGALGGAIVGVLAALAFGLLVIDSVSVALFYWLVALGVLVAVSVFGDLFG